MFVRVSLDRAGDYFALVDPEAEELVRQYRWVLHHCGKGKRYARARPTVSRGRREIIYMHRLVALRFLPPPGHPDMTHVDHGRGGSLDNRTANLKWEFPVVNRWGTANWGAEPRSAEVDLPF